MFDAERSGQKSRAIFTCLLLQLKKPFVQRLILLLLSALVVISIGCAIFIPWHAVPLQEETWRR